MTPKEIEDRNKKAIKLAELQALEPINFEALEAIVKKWMIIKDPWILRFLCSAIITNSFSDKGIWIMLIAPSGGGKTAFLSGLSYLETVYEVSLLTPQTFLSGMPGQRDTSLLPMVNGKILIFKDWTSILSLNKDAQSELMSQFREIWDGHLTKAFGNGKILRWDGKVSLICASTQSVDLSQQKFATLGERFINYRIIMPDSKEVGKKALQNRAHQIEMEWEIQKAFYAFFKWIEQQEIKALPELSQETQIDLIELTDFVVKARSGVIREFGYKQEIIFVPESEMPSRAIQQLAGIAAASTLLSADSAKQDNMSMIFKAALDCIPQTNYMVLWQLAQLPNQTTKEIASALGYPTGPIHRYLENLSMHRLCKRIAGKDTEQGGSADRWLLKEEYQKIILRYHAVRPFEIQKIEEGASEENFLKEADSIKADEVFENSQKDLAFEDPADA